MFLHYQYLTILPLFPCSLCHANDKTSIFNSDILANCQGNNELSSCSLSLEKAGQLVLCTPSSKTSILQMSASYTWSFWWLPLDFIKAQV